MDWECHFILTKIKCFTVTIISNRNSFQIELEWKTSIEDSWLRVLSLRMVSKSNLLIMGGRY
jgi:hypothetical protein